MAWRFTLYWTNLARYENCPQQFLWSRGWEDLDVGGGPGRKKPVPVHTSRHHAVMGIVIQSAIERMYNDELWRDPAQLQERLVKLVEKEWAYITSKPRNAIDYRVAGTKESLLQICRDGVLGYLRTMKKHRLLGEYSRAEVELLGFVNKYTPIGGRADLIIRRKDTGVSIIDGKNSKSKGKYTDPDQLRWYALLFYLAYRVMPDRLGFTYYRYPYGQQVRDDNDELVFDGVGEPVLETGVDWVPFTKDDIKGLAHRAVEARKGMDKRQFDANPVPKYCQWCDYETVCPQRQAQRAVNSKKRGKNKGVKEIQESGGGFTDLKLS